MEAKVVRYDPCTSNEARRRWKIPWVTQTINKHNIVSVFHIPPPPQI